MRRSKPLAAVAVAALFALAACGGGGGNSSNDPSGGFTEGLSSVAKDPERQAPAADIEGAQTGGTITVYLPGDPGPEDLDPTGGWSVTGNSIEQALVTRSLTQYARDPKTGDMVLVPDLATDLGQPNDDFTEWTFTIRDGVKWENGNPVTAEEVAWGITRSMDSTQFPGGPGTEYSVNYFADPEYKGPYTDKKAKWGGVSFDNDAKTVTIKMAKPFPDMDNWGAFMAMGPVPLGAASDPPDYGKKPLSTGPYKVESFKPGESLTLVKNDQWDPNTDPARHQYADGFVFKFNQDQAKVDEIMLSDNEESQTALSNALGSDNYAQAKEALGDRLVQQSGPCTSFLSPDYTKITDINIRKAIAYAYPYEDAWQAGGEVPGVTRVPANSIMPPGMAGKPGADYFADGEQFTYQPEKAKQLLADAGYEPGEFKITMVFYEIDPLAKAVQQQVTKGFEDSGFSVKAIPVQDSPYVVWLDPDNKINKTLNLRGVNWCADWPSGLTMIPPLVRTGAAYNTSFFSEQAVDDKIDEISTMPLDDQADAWGALDEEINSKYLPMIPTAFRNDLYVFGSKIGNPAGDGQIGAPDYKDLFVMQ
ncbi:MAG: ABC transporter substrate-binding protein [Nocardioidaceae bacterium]